MSMIQTGTFDLGSQSPSAKTGNDTSSFTTITFPTPFPAGSKVIVIPMVQTFNGPDSPGIRIADVTPTGFKFRINELVAGTKDLSDGMHASETIGWIAVTI